MTDLPGAIQPHDSNDPKYGLSWEHYLEAFHLYSNFVHENFSEELRLHRDNNPGVLVPLDELKVATENELVPIDGYLSFFSDLLGFSADIVATGTDSLPDFYGAAFVSAKDHPNVQVFLLSDSCLAFTHHANAKEFLSFVSSIFGSWLADGMLPQCFIGHGSFAERRPDFGPTPANFFGTQVTGTALVDAVNIQKTQRPAGSRILVSESAARYLTADVRLATDPKGSLELLLKRPMQSCLFDCIYYLLCLRSQQTGTRVFKHYVWSAASRTLDGSKQMLKIAQALVAPYFDEGALERILRSVDRVLRKYKLTSIEQPCTGATTEIKS